MTALQQLLLRLIVEKPHGTGFSLSPLFQHGLPPFLMSKKWEADPAVISVLQRVSVGF